MFGNPNNNSGGFYMPVAPAQNAGGFGADGGWWMLLFILAIFSGGWGGFGMGGMGGMLWPMMMGMGGMGGFGGWGMDMLYPWLNNSQHISDGFRDQQLQSSVGALQGSVTSGFGDVQTSLCSGFAGVNATVNGVGNAISQQISAGNTAALERSFAAQTATTQGLTALQAALQQCCCDNRAATSDLKYTVATEACADRAAVSDALQSVTMQGVSNTNAIVAAMRDGFQSIKDDLCNERIERKDDTIAQLRQELLFSRGQADRVAQTAELRAAYATIPGLTYERLRDCPVSTVPVYGAQPIFTCPVTVSGSNNGGCGCSGNTLFR